MALYGGLCAAVNEYGLIIMIFHEKSCMIVTLLSFYRFCENLNYVQPLGFYFKAYTTQARFYHSRTRSRQIVLSRSFFKE